MKTRILKQINNHVRIVGDDWSGFSVEGRKYLGLFSGWGEWEELNCFSTFKGAVAKKNLHIIMVVMRDLGYRREFVKRRTDRKKKKSLI